MGSAMRAFRSISLPSDAKSDDTDRLGDSLQNLSAPEIIFLKIPGHHRSRNFEHRLLELSLVIVRFDETAHEVIEFFLFCGSDG